MNQGNVLNPAQNMNRRRGEEQEQNLDFIAVSLQS